MNNLSPLSKPKLKADRIEALFKPEGHLYIGSSGEIYTSVTQAMKMFSEIVYQGIPTDVIRAKAALGTAVHLATEYYDDDDLDFEQCSERLKPYVKAYAKFRQESKCEILFKELRLVHPTRYYAGAIDRVVWLDGAFWIIDLKTTCKLYEFVGIQLAAYAELLNANLETRIPLRRAALQLKDNGNYVFREHSQPDDWYAFLACLTLNNWNINHELPIKYRL